MVVECGSERVSWRLRYASHLGYHEPERGLLRATARSDDPVVQIELAASLGFAGVQYARAIDRTPEERARVRTALDRHRLETGCMVYARREIALAPLWAVDDEASRTIRERALDEAFAVAAEVNAHHVIVFSGADPRRPLALQQAAFADGLKRVAPLAERRGIVLCLENMSRKSRTGTLVSHIAEAYAIAKAVDHPAVRIVFDTSHVQVMDGDVLDTLHAVWNMVALVQLADNPGRREPGSGELNFANILRAVRDLGYAGLTELEHDWSENTRACEERGLATLRALDAQLERPPRGHHVPDIC